jgi:rRNA processing protein Gar1
MSSPARLDRLFGETRVNIRKNPVTAVAVAAGLMAVAAVLLWLLPAPTPPAWLTAIRGFLHAIWKGKHHVHGYVPTPPRPPPDPWWLDAGRFTGILLLGIAAAIVAEVMGMLDDVFGPVDDSRETILTADSQTPAEKWANLFEAEAEKRPDGDPDRRKWRRFASELRTEGTIQRFKNSLTPEELNDPVLLKTAKRLGIKLD